MSFGRLPASCWNEEIPGARWFKADLHVHTIDDHPCGKAKMPPGVQGDPTDPKVLARYARAFLQGVVRAEIQVLGLNMSATVATRLSEAMTRARRFELMAVRSPDVYDLELGMDDGEYRPLSRLSGGQRVNLLLSLLLETHDERPLVIDQPEDELDKRFLFDTVLPALRRLKGRRQVIVATHDANIVVNGDAEQVVVLQVTANHGRVEVSGAIEAPEIREAIVATVDGGCEAFRLRQVKYGF